ncbi:carbohydrate ABC transporter permease [Clostridium yunnanense]|nr:sugar ABC transporter permease [Clostridium yunnanense]
MKMATYAEKGGKSKKSLFNFKSSRSSDTLAAYIMLAPMLIGFFLFTIYPIIYVIRYACFDYDGFTKATYTGLENFVRLFTRDKAYWISVLNTFVVSLGKMAIEIPLALILAVLLNSKTRINNFFRTALFLPTMISTAIIGIIFSNIFSSYNGIVNQVLINLGFINQGVNWFGSKWLAIFIVVISAVWSHIGMNMILFLMGLQSVPKDIYECADIDGANSVQKFFKITVPMLGPVMQTVLMLAIVEGMKLSDLVLVLTNGQPGGSTEVVMTYIYKFFFSTDAMSAGLPQYGYASAMAVVTALIIGLITIIYLKFSKKMNNIY